MPWTVGVKDPGYDLIIDVGASNVGANSAFVSGLPTTFQSGATMPVVNLQTELDDPTRAIFACYKDINVLDGAPPPVQRGWGSVTGVGAMGGSPIHGIEQSLVRYLIDRGRRVAVITHSVSGAGFNTLANAGATNTALIAHLTARFADIGSPFILRQILLSAFTGDTGSEALAEVVAAKMASLCSQICALAEAAQPGSAASTSFAMRELAPWFYENAGGNGTPAETARDQLLLWRATPVGGHLKYTVPVLAYAADANDTGQVTTDLNPTTLHPGDPYIYSIGERLGQVMIYNQVVPVYSP